MVHANEQAGLGFGNERYVLNGQPCGTVLNYKIPGLGCDSLSRAAPRSVFN